MICGDGGGANISDILTSSQKKVQIFKILIRGEGRGGGVKYLKLLFILVYNIPNVMIFYMLPQKWRGGATPSNSFSNFKKLSEKVPHPTPLMLRACISLFTFDQLVSIYLRGSPFSPFSDLVSYFTFTGSYKNVANNGNDHNIFIHFIVNSFEQNDICIS